MDDAATPLARARSPLATPASAPDRPPASRSLVRRLLWLTIAVVLITGLLFLIPSVTRERATWLRDRVSRAHLAALAIEGGAVSPAERTDLLRIAGVASVRLIATGHPMIDVSPIMGQPQVTAVIDRRAENWADQVFATWDAIVRRTDRLVVVVAEDSLGPAATVHVTLREGDLAAHLRSYALRVAVASLVIAAATGAVLFAALLRLLVRPMRLLIDNIAAFRADPERAAVPGPAELARFRRDEIGVAATELAAMQAELRTALWRNARLAAIGTAVAQVGHDLRGILAPALLAAERLEAHADPAIRQGGRVLARAVDQATLMVGRTLDFARDLPAAPLFARLHLRDVVEEAVDQAAAAGVAMTVTLHGLDAVDVRADRLHLTRVLTNLLRNAGEAGARDVVIAAELTAGAVSLTVADDGPGLPPRVQQGLFRPFVQGGRRRSTGLGLAIASDLMRAQGGDIALSRTGPAGTMFRLTLPTAWRRAAHGADGPASVSAAEAPPPADASVAISPVSAQGA